MCEFKNKNTHKTTQNQKQMCEFKNKNTHKTAQSQQQISNISTHLSVTLTSALASISS
jgi:hypothetical protein